MSEKHLTLAEALTRDMEAAGLIIVPRAQYELLKEAAEKWATDAAFKTEVRFVSDTGSVDIGVMCSQCGAKLACKHAADCKAARILDFAYGDPEMNPLAASIWLDEEVQALWKKLSDVE